MLHAPCRAQVETLSDEALKAAAEAQGVFVKLTPLHQERIVRALPAGGHVVGFMADGINDAPALRAADIRISVDSAVHIAADADAGGSHGLHAQDSGRASCRPSHWPTACGCWRLWSATAR